MNKLERFVRRLQHAGLTEKQRDEAVDALNEYLNAHFDELLDAQQGRNGGECL